MTTPSCQPPTLRQTNYPWSGRLFIALLAAALAGCAGTAPSVTKSLIPDKSLELSPNSSVPFESIVAWGGMLGAAYMVLDPLAPNWEIEEAAFPENRYFMTMKMKRFYTGGAGEARQAFNQRARSMMMRGGFDSYQILEYSESLESSILGSQRTAQGAIALLRTQK